MDNRDNKKKDVKNRDAHIHTEPESEPAAAKPEPATSLSQTASHKASLGRNTR